MQDSEAEKSDDNLVVDVSNEVGIVSVQLGMLLPRIWIILFQFFYKLTHQVPHSDKNLKKHLYVSQLFCVLSFRKYMYTKSKHLGSTKR